MTKITRIAVALVAAGLLGACGGPAAPLGPPTAQQILAKPAHSNLQDAHFKVTGKFVSQGVSVDLTGDGELVYKSPGAGRFKFQTAVAGQTVSFEQISVNGTDYTMTVPGNGKWTSKASTSGLGPTSFNGGSAFTYVGEETLPSGKAWHAKAKDKDGNPFEGWIRESDGYPLKYLVTQGTNALTLTFDKYNTGVAVSPPPAAQVVKG
jgi:outer membrane lipoprotein-sorting protein